MMQGNIIVGYNNEHFLFSNNANDITNQQTMNFKNKSELERSGLQFTKKITEFFGPKKQATRRRKYHFPIAFEPGQNIGMFEMFFEKESAFLYKTGTF